MKKKKYIDGRTKKLYEIDNQDQLIQEFQDIYFPYEPVKEKKTEIKGKGEINNKVSCLLFDYLSGYHVPTHYIKSMGKREMLIKKLEMIPIEIIVRNIAIGPLSKKLNVKEGTDLSCPVTEYFLKENAGKRPIINLTDAASLSYIRPDDVRIIEHLSSKINVVLKSFFYRRRLLIADFKLEFGLTKNRVTLGDEISLDSCRLIDESTNEKLFKDWSQSDASEAITTYEKLHDRIFN